MGGSCQTCGRDLGDRTRRALFCSRICAKTYGRQEHGLGRATSLDARCAACGGPLHGSGRSLFCSQACKEDAGGYRSLDDIPPREAFALWYPEALGEFDELKRRWDEEHRPPASRMSESVRLAWSDPQKRSRWMAGLGSPERRARVAEANRRTWAGMTPEQRTERRESISRGMRRRKKEGR